jgi:hypothetical protein
MRLEETQVVRVVMKIKVEGKRERRGPKKRWQFTIVNDMSTVGVCVCDVRNQNEWKFRTKVARP